MPLIDVARQVLRQNNNRPMSAGQLVDYIVGNGLWLPPRNGKTPSNTLTERINSDINSGKSFFKKRGGKFLLTAKGLSEGAVRLTCRQKRGYVYVVSNARSLLHADWVKIGSSDMDVGNRIFNLNSAVPYNFKVEVLMETVGYKKAEDALHEQFKRFSSDEDSDEYYRVSSREVAEAMRRMCSWRTYRGAVVWTEWENHCKVLEILSRSRRDPTKRGSRRIQSVDG